MCSTVLTDDDVRRVMPMSAAVDRIESALREHAEGTMVAPPRFRVDVDKGALRGTAGAVTHDDKAVGFRVYDRLQESHASHGQVGVVFDSDRSNRNGIQLVSKCLLHQGLPQCTTRLRHEGEGFGAPLFDPGLDTVGPRRIDE